MAEETHLVDGQMSYIRLLDAIVDHYICYECGAVAKQEPPKRPASARPHTAVRS
jgi:hypothetical protein